MTTIERTRSEPAAGGAVEATLAAVRAMGPTIAGRADEVERARRLPPDLVDQLKAAGCFRSLVPRRLGGAGATFAEHLRVIRELARADGSVGWTVMIGSSGPVILSGLPPATLDALYAPGPDLVGAGTFNPTGVATPVDGGYRVSGRWAFASGSQHADWFLAHCVVDDGRMPPLRMMVLPAAEVEVLDTWEVSGLCGTGSHDFTVDGAVVPDERTFSVFEESHGEGAMGRIPELTYSALSFANVAIGIAEGALAEVTTLATAKVPMFAGAPLATNPLFRHDLGEADAHLRAADALLAAEVASLWETAESGAGPTDEQRARARGTATWCTKAAATVADVAYTAGGGTALYSSSPLQRRMRDAHALTQHFAVKPDTLTLVGAVLAHQDVDLSFL
jgi:alkylation response protein AidB-like acyl-CoA dehydrogenase